MNRSWSPWDDPNVIEALKGRGPGEISLIGCDRCGFFSYYNEGSHFTCGHCDWAVSGPRLDRLIDEWAVITLADWTELADDPPGP